MRPATRPALMTIVAAGLAVGIALGSVAGEAWFATCAVAGCAAAFGAFLLARRAVLAMPLLGAASLAFGSAWSIVDARHVDPDDLAAHLGENEVFVRLRGEALTPPDVRSRAAGSMALFDYRPPATYFQVRVHGLLDREGRLTPVRGSVTARVDEVLPSFHAGDGVELMGFLIRPGAPQNPGEFDNRCLAVARGQAGIVRIVSRELVTVTPAQTGSIRAWWRRTHAELRHRAAGWLLAHLPESVRSEREALLADLLLGRRDHELDEVREAFRRLGLAHVLAISGFHLGVLAAFVMLALRAGGRSRRWHGLLVMAVVAFYLLIVEARTPVLRAGVMTMVACLGAALGRRLHVGGLVALSGVLLLIRRPDDLFTPGFQLSFGVVLGLIHLAPALRQRWFGEPNLEAASTAQMLGEWVRSTVAAAMTAWLVATPIVAFHYGMVAPLAALLSVVTLPLVSLLLAVGYTKMLLALLLPSGAMLLGVVLSVFADLLASIVLAADRLPLATVHVPYPSAAWTWTALAWVIAWSSRGSIQWRWPLRLVGLALAAWLLAPLVPWPGFRPALRIDMLAVGDGSCYVLRSGGRAAVFDAGSSTDLDAGRRAIVPALRRIGVRAIDFIAISHANLDHFSAVIEVVDEFDVKEVLLTAPFLRRAEDDPAGPLAMLLDGLTRRGVSVRAVAAGERRVLGESHLVWLHPSDAKRRRRVNDESMVIRLEAAGRRALLCGDVQREALIAILSPETGLAADVLELPHHGSYSEIASMFVARVAPTIVMQSTGWGRWQRDRWSRELSGVTRLVTARDGACSVEIAPDGRITTARFRTDR